MKAATWKTCHDGTPDGKLEHSMLDNCWNCAPWWETYPVSPCCGRKLGQAETRRFLDSAMQVQAPFRKKCPNCGQYVLIDPNNR